jgi:hypothetical protein
MLDLILLINSARPVVDQHKLINNSGPVYNNRPLKFYPYQLNN